MGVLSKLFDVESQEQNANGENPNVARARQLVSKGESLQKEIYSLENKLHVLQYGLVNPSKVELSIIHPEIVKGYGYGAGSYQTDQLYNYDIPDEQKRQILTEMIRETERKLKLTKYQYENL